MPRPNSVFTNPVPRGSSSPNRFGPFALRAWLFAEGEEGCRKLPHAVRSWVGGGQSGDKGSSLLCKSSAGREDKAAVSEENRERSGQGKQKEEGVRGKLRFVAM